MLSLAGAAVRVLCCIAVAHAMTVRFVTNKMCPFAHKAWLALECNNEDYQLDEIALYGRNGKPDWFWKLNPQGTVPVLVLEDGTVLADSDLILDHLAKTDDDTVVQAWRDRCNRQLAPWKSAVLSRDTKSITQSLLELEQHMVGPYLAGETLTVADCHVFPFVWRLEQEFEAVVPPKWKVWLETCRPHFQSTCVSSWWWWW